MPYINLSDYKSQARYFDFQGHSIAYWTEGSGTPLLFIHGFPSAAWDWHHQWQALKGDYQLIAMDMLGYGLSDKPHPHPYSLLQQADLVEALLQQLEVKECHVLAHDYGDSVAQELVRRDYKQQLSVKLLSTCFLNGGLFPEQHRPLLAQKLLKSALGPLFAKFLSKKSMHSSFKKIFGRETQPKEQEVETLWQLMEHNQGSRVVPSLLSYIAERRVHAEAWKDAMQNTALPLGLIVGLQDPISGAHMFEYYQEIIRRDNTWGIDAGHYPQIELPDVVLKHFQTFLAGI